MVVGEGFTSLCYVPCGSNLRSRSFSSFPMGNMKQSALTMKSGVFVMVVGEGFEPSKSMTADLQSAPFGRSGIPPLA